MLCAKWIMEDKYVRWTSIFTAAIFFINSVLDLCIMCLMLLSLICCVVWLFPITHHTDKNLFTKFLSAPNVSVFQLIPWRSWNVSDTFLCCWIVSIFCGKINFSHNLSANLHKFCPRSSRRIWQISLKFTLIPNNFCKSNFLRVMRQATRILWGGAR